MMEQCSHELQGSVVTALSLRFHKLLLHFLEIRKLQKRENILFDTDTACTKAIMLYFSMLSILYVGIFNNQTTVTNLTYVLTKQALKNSNVMTKHY
jgi:hypothetical protein